jgi:ABC-type Mn2+/Zn2+ transport system ATPase subunit
LFRDLAKEGRLLIASHHELQSVERIFDDVLLVKREQIAFGAVKEVFTPQLIASVYGA